VEHLVWYKENGLYQHPLFNVQCDGNYDILMFPLSVFKNVDSYLFVAEKYMQKFSWTTCRKGANFYV
jgi:hypothetical protein